jgi:hypothetical protein
MYLGRVLDAIGELGSMPRRAREGHFDDFQAPPEVASGFELIKLVQELGERARRLEPDAQAKVRAVVEAVKTGEFDATKAESERWEASAEGQATMRALFEGGGRRGG